MSCLGCGSIQCVDCHPELGAAIGRRYGATEASGYNAGDWKPGDVIGALLDGNEIVGIVRGGSGGSRHVFYADSVTTDQVAIKHLRNVRRFVVLDPEDREQVERLVRGWMSAADNRSFGLLPTDIDYMQAALREFANPKPPKPDEPTGLGAVVRERDEGGVDWLRVPLASNDRRWYCGDTGEWREWAGIDVFRVVHEGVES